MIQIRFNSFLCAQRQLNSDSIHLQQVSDSTQLLDSIFVERINSTQFIKIRELNLNRFESLNRFVQVWPMQVTSTVQWFAIAIRTRQNYKHSNLVHLVKIGCEVTAAKHIYKLSTRNIIHIGLHVPSLPNCTNKIIKINTARPTCLTNIIKSSP